MYKLSIVRDQQKELLTNYNNNKNNIYSKVAITLLLPLGVVIEEDKGDLNAHCNPMTRAVVTA